ncbi:hypothetical protein [Micromonospora sp. NPDC049891]|uniref:hypothetical protein n=1 Tax=Micromonospora sp. NPDC049891 TaxID=3155655 RepID=UPI003408DAC7
MALLRIEDPNGVILTVEEGDDRLHITVNGSIELDDTATRRLASVLQGGADPDAPIVSGREYRLLPNPQRSDGHERAVSFLHDATRVMALRGPNRGGDVLVMAIDGPHADESGLVHARFLAPQTN